MFRFHAHHAAEADMEHHPDTPDQLRAALANADAELKSHMASWKYAFAMGGIRDGSSDHPLHWETRAETERLLARCADLRARLSEFEP
jgi:hypothetical protein